MWEWIRFLAEVTGYFAWGMFLYVTGWCLLCAVNERRRDDEIQKRIDKIGSV